jgi:hypothetical protein
MVGLEPVLIEPARTAYSFPAQCRNLMRKAIYPLIVFTAGMASFTLGIVVLTPYLSTAPIPMPLLEYVDVFPGQTESKVIAHGFSCKLNNVELGDAHCINIPQTGPFALVSIELFNHIVTQVSFSMRDNALMVGDLPRAWGRPHALSTGQSTLIYWSIMHPGVHALVESSQLSFYSHVTRLFITRH